METVDLLRCLRETFISRNSQSKRMVLAVEQSAQGDRECTYLKE